MGGKIDNRLSVRRRLLAGSAIAVTALGATLGSPVRAAAPSAFSPGWYAQRSAQTGTAAAGTPAPIGITAAQQQQIDTSRANLTRAADALRSVRTLQSAAQAASAAAGFVRSDNRVVTDGLGKSGLYFARGAAAGDSYDVTTDAARAGAASANGLVWQGAELPTQKSNTDIAGGTTTTGTGTTATTSPNGKLVEVAAAGNTLVTVKQTAAKAILTWQNFDVGAHTTLYFNQTAADGTPQRSWVALNRVLAAPKGSVVNSVRVNDEARVSAAPSLILGKIRGEGEIYVINQNGVIFGGTSQVNVNSIVASSLDVGLPFQTLAERNNYFLTNTSGRNNFSFQYLLETDPEKIRLYGRLKLNLDNGPDSVATTLAGVGRRTVTKRTYAATIAEDALEGGVSVEAGGRIVSGTLAADGTPLGLFSANTNISRIVLAGPTVTNAGTVRSDDGQAILVGARNFSLYANDGLSGKAIDPNVRGALVEAGQQDLTSVAVGSTAGAARPNPFINRSLAETIFGNYAVGVGVPQGGAAPKAIIGVAQGGENYNRDQLNSGGFPELDENKKFEIQFDSRKRAFIVAPTFWNEAGLATTYAGSVTNTGLVSTPRGSVVVRANSITQSGVLHATTSVNQAGLIDIKASNVSSVTLTGGGTFLLPAYSNRLGSVAFSTGAVTTILPDDQLQADGTLKTIPSDALSLAAFKPSVVNISTENTLVLNSADLASNPSLTDLDRQVGNFGQTVIGAAQQTTASDGAVVFAAGSLLEVPSGNITVTSAAPVEQLTQNTYKNTAGQIVVPEGGAGTVVLPASFAAGITVSGDVANRDGTVTSGAVIDASGLTNVVLAMESNLIVVARVGQNELADSPLQRNSFIYRQKNILVDRRLSGVRDDGFAWVGTPLFDASGYVNARGQLVTERMLTGGNIVFGGSVVTGKNSLLNVAGGLLTYAAGSVATTQLITADGRRTVDIGRADPLAAYAGFAGQFTEDHSKWNVTTTYSGLSLANAASQFEASYVEGSSGGKISFTGAVQSTRSSALTSPTETPASGKALVALDGRIAAGAVTGPYQRQGSAYNKKAPSGGTLDLSQVLTDTVTIAADIDIAARRAAAPADFLPATVGGEVASTVFLNQYWSTEALADSGLANLVFGTAGFFNTYQGIDQAIGATKLISIGADANPLAGAAAFSATTLALPDGATLRLTGHDIVVAADIVAHGGSVTAALLSKRLIDADYQLPAVDNGSPQFQPTTAALPRSTFMLGAGKTIDLSGKFVNDLNATRDSLTGFDFVNGGTLAISTTSILNDIDFGSASSVDLTSGGYVTAAGRLGTAGSAGLGRGQGGNLSIELSRLSRGYTPLDPTTDPLLVPDIAVADIREQIDSNLTLGGTIAGNGFQGGGTFTLIAPEIVIGSGIDGTETGLATLTPGFFTDHGFGGFALTALLTARIDDGVTLALNQQQFVPGSQIATATTRDTAAVLGRYAAGTLQRTPVNFSLTALGQADFNSHAVSTEVDDIKVVIPKGASYTADNALTLGAGATIAGDPLARITLSATGQMRLGADGQGGGIIAAGGTITISQRFGYVSGIGRFTYGEVLVGGGPVFPSPSYETGLIASGFAIDAGGVLLSDLRTADHRAGTVVAGGTVILDGGSEDTNGTATGAILARSGSTINVAGASGIVDLPADGLVRSFTPVTVASAGGTLRLDSATIKSTLSGAGGSASSAGATLDVGASRAVQSVGIDVDTIVALAAPTALAGTTTISQGALVADNLLGNGFDALIVRGGLTFYDNVAIDLKRSVTLTGGFAWKTALTGDALPGRAAVTIAAPYIRWQTEGTGVRPVGLALVPTGSNDTLPRADLTLSAATIDISDLHSVTGFATTTLAATGDLRFIAQLVTRPPAGAPASAPRSTFYDYAPILATSGDLILSAAQVYPATGVAATISARFQDGLITSGENTGTITILGNSNSAGSATPLSAGGSLTLNAGHIVQDGILRAPLGQINFGVAGGGTQTVELKPGSLTSVTAGTVPVPYGTTVNGSSWFYANLSGAPLTAVPAKAININSVSAELDQGATLDLSGGGDVYATEFIPGLGGQRNVLTTSLSSDAGAAVYAILPGQQPLVAPLDPNGYSNLVPDVAGQTLTLLTDAGGLKAGTYTLYAGSYATLPGAYRVQVAPSTTDIAGGTNATLADGSVVVAGRLGLAGTPFTASRTSGYRVFDQAAWRQYSQIETVLGTKFFTAQAAASGVVPAPLPADAGRLSIAVSAVDQALRTMATFDFGIATGGRGGQVDIAASKIAVVSAGLQAGLADQLAGYLVLSPGDVRGFNAVSVLLGATRLTDIGGDALAPVANTIRVATTAADPLALPELLLVTTGGTDNVANIISFDAGSVVTATGAFSGQPAGTIRFGQTGRLDVLDNPVYGDGNIVRLSNGGPVSIVRLTPNPAPRGIIAIASTAATPTRLDGGKALQIDASSNLSVDISTILGGTTTTLAGREIRFSNTATPGSASLDSAVVQLLAGSQQLTFRAQDRLIFDQPTTIAAATGAPRITQLTLNAPVIAGNTLGTGGLVLDAATVVMSNDFALPAATGGATEAAIAGGGHVQVTADNLVLTGKDRVFQGFDQFDFTAAKSVLIGDGKSVGTLTLPGDVNLTSPLIALADSSDQRLVIAGSLTTARPGAAAAVPVTTAIGGKLALDVGGTVTIADTISARAGILDVRSRTGNIILASGGVLAANGFTQLFSDKEIVVAGGAITLAADAGNVVFATGSSVSVAADPRGNAGSLDIAIGSAGNLVLDGSLAGAGGGGSTLGGTFDLYTNGAVALEPLAQKLVAGGFTGGVAVRSGLGNLDLTTTVLTARTVTLTADDRSAGGGFVNVATTIDASAPDGGTIALYGQRGVNLAATAVLRAVATAPAVEDRGGRGGSVAIGTGVLSPDNVVQNEGGVINLAAGSQIDVSDAFVGGVSTYSANRGSGGASVSIRAPIIARDVAVTLGSTITGARTVSLEAYQRFTTGNSAFDGIIDPAGWFNADGSYVAGTWTDAYGGVVKAGLGQTGVGELTEASYFAPITYDTATGAVLNHANQAHVDFYQDTLVDFVQNPGIDTSKFAGVAGLHIQPGIELVNSDTAVNGGGISVLSNWNLGAVDDLGALVYRTKAGAEPGILTIRAVGDIVVKASITDGFLRTTRYNPYNAFDYTDSKLVHDTYSPQSDAVRIPAFPKFPANFGQKIGDVLNPEVNQYYHNYEYFVDRLFNAWDNIVFQTGLPNNPSRVGTVAFPTDVVSPQTNYQAYSVAYQKYLDESIDEYNDKQATRGDNAHYHRPVPPAQAPDEATYPSYAANYFAFLNKIIDYNKRYSGIGQALIASPNAPAPPPGVINTQAVRDFNVQVVNTIANNATAGDPLTITSSDLMTGGTSFSYRLVAGSDTASARPDALRAASVTIPGSGNLTLGEAVLTAATATGSGDVIRTGTGSISIATTGDVRWLNGNDVIYTAGIDNGFVDGFVDTGKITRVEFQPFTKDGTKTVTNEEVLSGNAQTKGVFGKQGGDITIVARGSLIGAAERGQQLTGFRDPIYANNRGYDGQSSPLGAQGSSQYYIVDSGPRDIRTWLLAQGVSSDLPGAFGQFGGTSQRARTLSGANPVTINSLQSAEWVRTGLVSGTVLTLGGGNVRLDAGGNISDASVFLISTLQASGGKTGGSEVSVTHFGGGDLSLHAGGDITGATIILGRGKGQVVADGAIRQYVHSVLAFDENQFLIANDPDGDGFFVVDNLRDPIPLAVRAASLVPQDVLVVNGFTVENGTLSVLARGDVEVAPLNQLNATDLSYDDTVLGAPISATDFSPNLPAFAFSQLGTSSATDIRSVTGTLAYARPLLANTNDRGSTAPITPTLTLAALRGDLTINGALELAPSPTGNLDLLAYGSIFYSYAITGSTAIGLVDPAAGPQIRMDDRAQSQIATVEHPEAGSGVQIADSFGLHSPTTQALHNGDLEASHIVALNGDLTTGSGLLTNPVAGVVSGAVTSISLAEAAEIYAGNDIVDMRFTGQNANAGDITSITAGRDITYTLIAATAPGGVAMSEAAGGTYTIGGQGTLALVAGRNLSLAPALPRRLIETTSGGGTKAGQSAGVVQGALAAGNDLNPYLPSLSADIELLFGVGPTVGQPGNAGIAAFVSAYVDPAKAATLATDYGQTLLDFVNLRLVRAAREADPATSFAGIVSRPPAERPDPNKADPVAVAAAYALFETLAPAQQRALVDRIFFAELRAISQTSDLAQYLNYPRAYTAIDTLFPAAAGYTDNFTVLDAGGKPRLDADGKPLLPTLARTGNFNMVDSLVQTSYGSGVTLLGPGGSAVLGGLNVNTNSVGSQGILTLRNGPIDIFVDGSLSVNNSRIFTLQGGDETIFATNGNIDAGRGKRTASFLPPLVVSYLPTTTAVVNFGGLVSGAGIGTLQTLPGSAVADIYLLAPRGDIDAGDAGIRSSGNLSIVANQVLNGDNLVVKGSTTGVPQAPTVSATAVAIASNVSQAAGDNETTAAQRPLDSQAIVTVQVTGCSDEDVADGRCARP